MSSAKKQHRRISPYAGSILIPASQSGDGPQRGDHIRFNRGSTSRGDRQVRTTYHATQPIQQHHITA